MVEQQWEIPLSTRRTQSSSKYSCSACEQSRATTTCPLRPAEKVPSFTSKLSLWLSCETEVLAGYTHKKSHGSSSISDWSLTKFEKSITACCCLKHNFQLYSFLTHLSLTARESHCQDKTDVLFPAKGGWNNNHQLCLLGCHVVWKDAIWPMLGDCCRQEAEGIIYDLPNGFKHCLSFRKHISGLYKEICTKLIKHPPLVKHTCCLNSQYPPCMTHRSGSKALALEAAPCSWAGLSITIRCRGCSSSATCDNNSFLLLFIILKSFPWTGNSSECERAPCC